MADEIEARVQKAEALARLAGRVLLSGSPLTVSLKSSGTDVATDVDKTSEKLIVDALTEAFPNDGILAEEGSGHESDNGFSWVIDPLDGTSNYIRGLRASAVSIGLQFEGEALAGVVYDPWSDELFSTTHGLGLTVNGRRVKREEPHHGDLDRSFVSVSGSNRPGIRSRRAKLVRNLVVRADSVRDPGSTALALCWTAVGRYDAHVGIDVAPWDVAAGLLIATEAGCQAEGFRQNEAASHERMIVAPAELIEAVRAVVLDS